MSLCWHIPARYLAQPLNYPPIPCPTLPSAGKPLQLRSWLCLAAPSAALKHLFNLWIPTRCTVDHLFASHNAFNSTYRFSCPPAISQSSDLLTLDLCVKGMCSPPLKFQVEVIVMLSLLCPRSPFHHRLKSAKSTLNQVIT